MSYNRVEAQVSIRREERNITVSEELEQTPLATDEVAVDISSDESAAEPITPKKAAKKAARKVVKKMTTKKAAKKKKATKKESESTGQRGRVCVHAGKNITKLVKENPRRKGTNGFDSFNKIKSGMTYEQYIAAGGRLVDLNWDIEHRYVKVSK
jgi:hypothetical protein